MLYVTLHQYSEMFLKRGVEQEEFFIKIRDRIVRLDCPNDNTKCIILNKLFSIREFLKNAKYITHNSINWRVGGNFIWTLQNNNNLSAYLTSLQIVTKQNIAVTKSCRLNYNQSIS